MTDTPKADAALPDHEAAAATADALREWQTPFGNLARAYLALSRPATPPRVMEAAQALVNRIEAIHADKRYQAVWFDVANHGRPYAGPNYANELSALKSALDAAPASTAPMADEELLRYLDAGSPRRLVAKRHGPEDH